MRRALLALGLLLAGCSKPAPGPLRVCADPNNLPFSNQRGEGFENKLAELLAAELRRPLEYVWWAQRRGNVRETLNAGRCDIIPGTASGLEMLATTAPYYASTYVAVTRPGQPPITSFDDPRLRRMRIGVQMIGDDFSNTPPAHALSRRGIVGNVRGFMVYGDYAQPEPQAPIITALANGEIDIAFAWGPVGSFFASRQNAPLQVARVRGDEGEQMVFPISVGLRKRDEALKAEVEQALARRRTDVERLLDQYRVPRVPVTVAAARGRDDDD